MNDKTINDSNDSTLDSTTEAPKNNLRNEVFGCIDELSLPGQRVALRAIANSAVCSAVFLAHSYTSWDGPTHDTGELTESEMRQLDYYERLPSMLSERAELYSIAYNRYSPMAQGPRDMPMSLKDAIEFATTRGGSTPSPDLPDELLEQLGITRAQLRLIDEAESKRRERQDAQLREAIKENVASITSEIESEFRVVNRGDFDEQEAIERLPVKANAALFDKISKKLGEGMGRAIAQRARNQNALGEAMLLSGDIKLWDKIHRAFLKETAGDQDVERMRDVG